MGILMKPIQDRTQWHEYTTIERCQETGKPVKVYSLDVECALIWDSMTNEEKKMLLRYDELCEKGVEKMTSDDKKEWWKLNDWVIKNDLDLSIIPRNK
jgi:predicted transcriptional regulator